MMRRFINWCVEGAKEYREAQRTLGRPPVTFARPTHESNDPQQITLEALFQSVIRAGGVCDHNAVWSGQFLLVIGQVRFADRNSPATFTANFVITPDGRLIWGGS